MTRHLHPLFSNHLLTLGVILTSACSCDPSGEGGDTGVRDSSFDAALDDGSSGDASRDGSTRDARLDTRVSDDAGIEICDGIDNDGNGIIDEVDVGGDGVCDCLLIATLGIPGAHGDGDVFATWLNERSDTGATSLTDQVLTAELLEPFQVIVVQDLRGREYAESEVAALRGWIEAGGGLMTLIGYGDRTERTNVNTLLEPSGLRYGETPILAGSPTVPITTWHTHPVSEEVMEVGVDNGYEVEGSGEVIAEEGEFVVLRGATLGEGKVLVWGDEWITYDSEWTGHPEYQLERFWLNAIKWLTPATECQVPILI